MSDVKKNARNRQRKSAEAYRNVNVRMSPEMYDRLREQTEGPLGMTISTAVRHAVWEWIQRRATDATALHN